jgi:hypothetical protein
MQFRAVDGETGGRELRVYLVALHLGHQADGGTCDEQAQNEYLESFNHVFLPIMHTLQGQIYDFFLSLQNILALLLQFFR